MGSTRAYLLAATLAAVAAACDDPAPGAGVGGGDPVSTHAEERLDTSAWLLSSVGDFNGDGLTDVLWDDVGHSRMAVWLMSGTGVLQRGAPIPGPPGAAWSAASASDFNFDGRSDVRWFDYQNGDSAIWLMSSTKLLLSGPTFPAPTGGVWTRVTSLDFNFDRMADLLWRNTTTGAIQVWLMNGTAPIFKGAPVAPPIGAGWIATGASDFDFDGLKDVIWYNPTSRMVSIALMKGTTLLSQGAAMPGPSGPGLWSSLGAPDFNGDRMGDLLWYNAVTQKMLIWLMAGGTPLLVGPEIPAPPGGGWSLASIGDFNGDFMADVVWENLVTHRFAIWLMNGTDVLEAGPEIPEPSGP
jgi:hypothetical protein